MSLMMWTRMRAGSVAHAWRRASPGSACSSRARSGGIGVGVRPRVRGRGRARSSCTTTAGASAPRRSGGARRCALAGRPDGRGRGRRALRARPRRARRLDVCAAVAGVWPQRGRAGLGAPARALGGDAAREPDGDVPHRARLPARGRARRARLASSSSRRPPASSARRATPTTRRRSPRSRTGCCSSLKNEVVRVAPRARVNVVAPGWTESPMTRGTSTPSASGAITRTMALRKVAQPEDVARQVVVLASDELSGHVTGQVVTSPAAWKAASVHDGPEDDAKAARLRAASGSSEPQGDCRQPPTRRLLGAYRHVGPHPLGALAPLRWANLRVRAQVSPRNAKGGPPPGPPFDLAGAPAATGPPALIGSAPAASGRVSVACALLPGRCRLIHHPLRG